MSELPPTLFIDRDGTLIEEPPDEQVDAFEKLRLLPGVIPALLRLRDAGFRFVMVTNQDGLGTDVVPDGELRGPAAAAAAGPRVAGHRLRRSARLPAPRGRRLRLPQARDAARRTATWPHSRSIRARSRVIGDRETDLELAARLGIAGICASARRRRGLAAASRTS